MNDTQTASRPDHRPPPVVVYHERKNRSSFLKISAVELTYYQKTSPFSG
jgi:hypothetical protein